MMGPLFEMVVGTISSRDISVGPNRSDPRKKNGAYMQFRF